MAVKNATNDENRTEKGRCTRSSEARRRLAANELHVVENSGIEKNKALGLPEVRAPNKKATPRTVKFKNKTRGRHRTNNKLAKSKAGKTGLNPVPYNLHELLCEYCDEDRVTMYVARRRLRWRMIEAKVRKKMKNRNEAMVAQVTCSGSQCCDILRHRKDEEELEDRNCGLGDGGHTPETALTDVLLNTIQSVN